MGTDILLIDILKNLKRLKTSKMALCGRLLSASFLWLGSSYLRLACRVLCGTEIPMIFDNGRYGVGTGYVIHWLGREVQNSRGLASLPDGPLL